VIVKHANPCGVAQAETIRDAYREALACDSVSAFGGIVAVNQPLGREDAEEISAIFTEVVIAPDADEEAREIFARKKNLRLLLTSGLPEPLRTGLTLKSIAGGYLLQSRDNKRIGMDDLKVVTRRAPNERELADRIAAWKARDAAEKARWPEPRTIGSAVASDAFFPFADGLLAAVEAGATAVIQPGGSIRDEEVIAAADEAGLAMVFTGMRHFRH
jgi:phosphoribosylaminoimidazolecarboxamide formyltransferase/IMP cyclohydrolase